MNRCVAIMIVGVLLSLSESESQASDTIFTYQGQLKENGTPADGSFNLEFSLWDAIAGGSQVGSTIPIAGVQVTDGEFTVELDFGADALDNSDRWMEITVNSIPLSPRSPITRSPYAIQTRGIYVNEDESFVGIGRTNSITPSESFGISKNTTSFGGMYIETNATGKPFYGYSEGGDIDAYHYLDGNDGSWNLWLDGQEVLSVASNGWMFLAPGALLSAHNVTTANLTASNQIEINASNNNTPLVVFDNPSGQSASFFGDVAVSGFLQKSGGGFTIDHPLDPKNKYLTHSFVESPDMMNIYNGNVVTGEKGFATVELPKWFDALNRDFRYQLTVIGSFAQAIVAKEIEDNRFVVQTDVPNIKVSWQVTGIRDDAYARTSPYDVEKEKPENERGRYLTPEAFGHGSQRGIGRQSVQAMSAVDK